MESIQQLSSTFFKPDTEFVKWLGEYAKGRLIVDVGCGNGHLLELLKKAGYSKAVGIEPTWDVDCQMKQMMKGSMSDMIKVLPNQVEHPIVRGILEAESMELLIVFARPCHSTFVEAGISIANDKHEALYITVPENVDLYQDLGRYDDLKVKLDHTGTSEDGEVVYSVRKK